MVASNSVGRLLLRNNLKGAAVAVGVGLGMEVTVGLAVVGAGAMVLVLAAWIGERIWQAESNNPRQIKIKR